MNPYGRVLEEMKRETARQIDEMFEPEGRTIQPTAVHVLH